jgi:Viral BACON domain/Putative binding domain, N-terminal
MLVLNAVVPHARQAQAPGNADLRIVVIEGEDAVNVIQQKTAVAPIVEIRDRNGLPVGGVAVTFAISSPNAVFAGGLQQLTVVTDAAGRAAISSLTPMSSGAYQINVAAAFQGQTAATTITQTNFMTLAEAAQAGTAGAAGQSGAQNPANASGSGNTSTGNTGNTGSTTTQGTTTTAGGGGGLSNLAIIGIAGAGVAATAGAVLVLRKEDCQYSVSPGSLNLGGAGTSTTLTVSVTNEGCEPVAWTASASGGFLSVSPSGGSGPGSVTVSSSTNTSGGTRSGSISIAGTTVSVSQAAACAFTVTPGFGNLGPGAGNVIVNVTVGPSGCSPSSWTASSSASFVTSVSPTSGSGTGVVTLGIAANTGAARSGTVTIAGQTLTINQGAGIQSVPCNTAAVAGSDLPVTRSVDVGRTSGRFTFTYQTYSQQDRMVVSYEGRTLFDTGCVGTFSSRDISFSGGSSVVTVTVTPNCAGGFGTAWEFTVACARP